jgi:hypothetical protein
LAAGAESETLGAVVSAGGVAFVGEGEGEGEGVGEVVGELEGRVEGEEEGLGEGRTSPPSLFNLP